ncbi:MAG TPA: hypothetical protein VKI44_00745 [Acetobacteraceae bacterium]|nr:hypothetical protein [Acetobacteraceae bacterium]
MDIERIGSQPSGKGPAEDFTGMVRIDPLNSPPEPAREQQDFVWTTDQMRNAQ